MSINEKQVLPDVWWETPSHYDLLLLKKAIIGDALSNLTNHIDKNNLPPNNIVRHFDWNDLALTTIQRQYLDIMSTPAYRSTYYNYLEKYHPIIDDKNTHIKNDDTYVDFAWCAPFATAMEHAFCMADGMTLPLNKPWSTWELNRNFGSIKNNYRVEWWSSFNLDTLKALPDGTILTAQYDNSRYKEYGPTHSLVKTELWLIHLFHEDMIVSPWSLIKPKTDKHGNQTTTWFALNTGLKANGTARIEWFTLVWWSSMIVPIYDTSANKIGIKLRNEYTVTCTKPMSARWFAELVAQSLSIPHAAVCMLLQHQNTMKWLDTISSNWTLTTLGSQTIKDNEWVQITTIREGVSYAPQRSQRS